MATAYNHNNPGKKAPLLSSLFIGTALMAMPAIGLAETASTPAPAQGTENTAPAPQIKTDNSSISISKDTLLYSTMGIAVTLLLIMQVRNSLNKLRLNLLKDENKLLLDQVRADQEQLRMQDEEANAMVDELADLQEEIMEMQAKSGQNPEKSNKEDKPTRRPRRAFSPFDPFSMPGLNGMPPGGANPFFILDLQGNKKSASEKNSDIPKTPNVKFKDVAGIDEAVESVQDIVAFLKNPEDFNNLGGKMPKGILLAGPPGTGKTLLARAVAGEAGVPFFSASGSEFTSKFIGGGAENIRNFFENARKHKPCIVFIDEIDSVGRKRDGTHSHPEDGVTLNQLLTEMDGFDKESGVIVMAATNRTDILDEALKRPGRFDRHVNVPKPDEKGREKILAVHIANVKTDGKLDLSVLAKASSDLTGAQLANIVNEAAIAAAKEKRPGIRQADLVKSLEDEALGGKERKSYTVSEKKRTRTAIHEAGHIVKIREGGLRQIMKATVVPREKSLGHVWSIPLDDEETIKSLRSFVESALAGRAAEEVFFNGDIGPGAGGGEGSDIDTATDIVRRMVREFGMSELGPMNFSSTRSTPYGQSPISNATSELVDQAEQKIFKIAYENTVRYIQENRESVQKLADALMKHGTLSGEQIEEILSQKDMNARTSPAPAAQAMHM